MLEQLTIDNIDAGGLLEAANEILAELCDDVANRPHKDGAREITIKVKISPKIETANDRVINQPIIDWEIAKKAPGHKGMTSRGYVKDGRLLINLNDMAGRDVPGQTYLNEVEKSH